MKSFSRILALVLVLAWSTPALPCTNFLVTKGASKDGATYITYAADSHTLYGELYYRPAGKHPAGTSLRIFEWDTGKFLGEIPEAAETYSVVGNINEHQVSIGETTFGGREELVNPKGKVDYGSLMYLALQRSKTAREAIDVMVALVEEHGYYSEGEAFSIADPKEVWFMVMIGKGPEKLGANWVALKIPDGYVSAHANYPRIRQFPLNDPENCRYNKDIFEFARSKGWFKGEDKEFSFSDTFAPLDWATARSCEGRVWSFFRRIAPASVASNDFVRGTLDSVRMPLWVKPDAKLTAQDLMNLMRDHFEGTEMDLTYGVGAGPFNCPYRWRPMKWEVDGVTYVNDRATATQQTGFSFIAQMRNWLPNPIGGVLWFSVDDASSTVYVPMYCGILEAPRSYAVGTGSFYQFSWDSAFWVFNVVANWAYTRYSDMIKDIRVVQNELEGSFIAQQPELDAMALALHKQAPGLARRFLTQQSAQMATTTVTRWRKLAETLFMTYMDGNVRDEAGKVLHPPYPERWYRGIVQEHGDLYKFRKFDWEVKEEEEKTKAEELKKQQEVAP